MKMMDDDDDDDDDDGYDRDCHGDDVEIATEIIMMMMIMIKIT